ncbi:MAG: cation-translocating P-type ATPase, partial [Vallitaleaceae bacterium]|nr:cation-translocating P-type ATPase [Vallitaleaceae bacterium]
TMIIDQFKDFMIIILIIAILLSIFIADELADGIVIIGIVILNAILGVTQENRASNALSALKQMAAPKAKVVRAGQLVSIDSKELVPGDLVVLESGDYVPADLRVIENVNLKIDESALTGESVAVEKSDGICEDEHASIADRQNMAYMSTIVTYGRGKGIVTGTGMKTEIGKIATMLSETEETQTPLQIKLASFGKLLGIICIFVSIIIIILGLLRGQPLIEVFMTAISLAVAAIPEGLPAVVTVVLAMGMQRMIKRNAIMKRLSAVETLGSTTVICTDKTGTLTQNKMTVTKVYDGADEWSVTGTGYGFGGKVSCADKPISQLNMLFLTATLCNDSEVKDGEVIGDPTEGALIVLGAKANYDKATLNTKHPRLKEFPFDSERKLMSTLHFIDGDYYMLTKGAPDVILSRVSKIDMNGSISDITGEDKLRAAEKNHQYAAHALRVLGYAYKKVDKDAVLEKEEDNLIFAGLSCMIDPPRQEAKDAVKLCKRAGIRVVMITGDHILTAQAIAKELGIIEDFSQALEGGRINDYDDDAFLEVVQKTNVFARVSPEHKVRIVDFVRKNGDVAAMTGDGVNDAPALKKADSGIAMGITGTDVAKEAADMILTDDNFASIVDAVEEGRIIYANIRKFVGFLLACNVGEILIIFTAMLIGWPVPLVPIQLLWVNLITDSFPAFALGLEKGEAGMMNQQPRNPKDSLVDKKMGIAIAFQSLGLAAATLASYRIGFLFAENLEADAQLTVARTFCFTTLILGEMLRAYSARSEDIALFKMKVLGNKYLNYSVLIAIVLLILVLYVPFLQPIFTTSPLGFLEFGVAFGLGLVPLLMGEIAKVVKKY